MKWYKIILFIICLSVLFVSCEEDYTPKPLGKLRVSFPENDLYQYSDSACPFSFKVPKYAFVASKDSSGDNCHKNILLPYFNAALYASYIPVSNEKELFDNLNLSQDLAYEHRVKASSIDEKLISNDSTKVYGQIFRINGNVASNFQFYITDSVNHFFRGALYFNVKPNIDSLKPSLDFVVNDFEKMIESFSWR